jgi:hypothetical protein
MTMKRQSGMSFAEVLVGLALVGVTILASLTVVNGALTGSRNNMDKQFATQKAIAMLEELRALIQGTQNVNATVLDDYDDGTQTQPVLTTQLVNDGGGSLIQPLPNSELSGNLPMTATSWLYERRIEVRRIPGMQASNVRLVRVQVYKNTQTGKRLLAEVASVLSAAVTPFPPTQVYDVYAVAIENVPGWWVFMSNLIPFVEGSVQDLQARNPGLEYRVHWVRKLSYGRDRMYRPYINVASTNPSTNAINWVYFYPGMMPAGSADDFYYPPGYFSARMNFDDTSIRNDYDPNAQVGGAPNPTYNPAPYALADQFNHAMRTPDARALFDARVAAGNERRDTPPLHLLIDDMYNNPDAYRNAILINLHGELMPFPPVRNYSDAAKIPDELPGVRVVTHPEQLRYRENEGINLRVYSYKLRPAVAVPGNPNPWLSREITITLRNLNWTPAAGDIQRIVGGTDQDLLPGADVYVRQNAPSALMVPFGTQQMYYDSQIVGSDTIIKLYNSPLISPCVTSSAQVPCNDGGLYHENDRVTRRLYGMEYIPSPIEDLTQAAANSGTADVPFTEDLSWPGPFPKNTARWVIRIPNAVTDPTCAPGCVNVNRRLDIETKIGDDANAGTVFPAPNEPANRSATYTWKGTDDWIFGTPAQGGNPATPANLPFMERFQFLGDPRHLPYSDLKRPHVGSGKGAFENALGLGYNIYFDDFEEGYDPTVAGELLENYMGAEMIAPKQGPYFIDNSTRNYSIFFNATEVDVALTGNGNRSATQICTDLNNSGAFSLRGICTVFNNRVRVIAKNHGTTLRFNTAQANDPDFELGHDVAPYNGTYRRGAWEGWRYTDAGNVAYGVENDTVDGNDQRPHNDGWFSGGAAAAPGSADEIEFDMTRVGQGVRQALQRTNALWTTLTGWSYYYVGIGNEIGYDAANNFPNSIPVSNLPFTGAGGSGFEQSIISCGGNNGLPNVQAGGNIRCGVKYIKEDGGNLWWAISWLGEIYPDERYDDGTANDWESAGNLPTGNGVGTFRRVARNSIRTTLYSAFDMPGTTFRRFNAGGGNNDIVTTTRRQSGFGCTNFFWGGTPANSFRHEGWGMADVSNRQAPGGEIAARYAMPVPTSMPTARPFGINIAGATPDNFLDVGYGVSNRLGILSEFFRFGPNANLGGSSLTAVVDPTIPPNPAPQQPHNVMFVVANGLSPAGAAGNAFIGRWSLLTLIHSYFISGQFSYTAPNTININGAPTGVSRVKQVPQVTITNPNLQTQLGTNPSNINVTWAIQWRRWDGTPYTNAYNAAALALDQAIPLMHRILYSNDNGRNWYHMNNNALAPSGQREGYLQAGTTFNWDVADINRFPKGNYLIRIETYREGLPLHYAYHQFQVFIDR